MKDGELRSLVVMVSVANLVEFFELVNIKYELNIETQPTHITLYVKESGVYLIDSKDLKTKTEIIKKPKQLSKLVFCLNK